MRARIASEKTWWRMVGKETSETAQKCWENPLRESRVPFRVAGQSDHVFRSRIRIKRILIFAVGQGRRIYICEIPFVCAYGNLRRAREISRRERTLDCFFPRFSVSYRQRENEEAGKRFSVFCKLLFSYFYELSLFIAITETLFLE